MDTWIAVDGLELRVRELGTGEPVILFLHGLLGHAREWDPLLDALSPGFRLVVPDHRGHGESGHADAYRLELFVRDALGVLDALGVERAHVVGHSLGGMVGMRLAAERPDRVERLVVLDVGPESLCCDWARNELPGRLQGFASAAYGTVDEAVQAWLTGDPLAREPLVRHYVTHALRKRPDGQWVWRFDAAGFLRFLRDLDPDALWSALSRISAPTLLIRGERSSVLTERAAERVLERLHDATFVQIPDGGHDLGVQQPEAVTRAVLGFLQAEVRRSAPPTPGSPAPAS